MEMYLLKSALCLAIFFTFYKALLETTSIHNFKRFYLLVSVLISFGIPFITFTTYVETPIGSNDLNNLSLIETIAVVETQFNYLIVLWSLYLAGVVFYGTKFFRNLNKVIRKIRLNPKHRSNNIINVLLNEKVVPHTFLNYVFFNKKHFERHEIPQEVIDHEITHAREKHSLDVLLIELCRVIFWFNPVFYFIRHAIKLNHEFLADRSVLRSGTDTSAYQKTLLAFSSNAKTPQLANSINYSFIKKRFTVMKTNTSKKAIWVRSLLLLPIIALALFSFSSREEIPLESEEIPIETEVISGEYLMQTSATREEMKEYTKLAKKYNAMPKEKRIVKLKDLKKLEYIYQKMSPKQKADAEPFPECIPPPPPPPNVSDAPKPVKVVKGVNDTDANIPPPPPPAPVAPVIDLTDVFLNDATFYLNDKKISKAKAQKLVEDSGAVERVDVVAGNDGKPIVYFWNK